MERIFFLNWLHRSGAKPRLRHDTWQIFSFNAEFRQHLAPNVRTTAPSTDRLTHGLAVASGRCEKIAELLAAPGRKHRPSVGSAGFEPCRTRPRPEIPPARASTARSIGFVGQEQCCRTCAGDSSRGAHRGPSLGHSRVRQPPRVQSGPGRPPRTDNLRHDHRRGSPRGRGSCRPGSRGSTRGAGTARPSARPAKAAPCPGTGPRRHIASRRSETPRSDAQGQPRVAGRVGMPAGRSAAGRIASSSPRQPAANRTGHPDPAMAAARPRRVHRARGAPHGHPHPTSG